MPKHSPGRALAFRGVKMANLGSLITMTTDGNKYEIDIVFKR